jgi:hypothetical protein
MPCFFQLLLGGLVGEDLAVFDEDVVVGMLGNVVFVGDENDGVATRSAPITSAVRRAFPCSGCWTTGAGPVAGSTVRVPRG